MKSLLPLLGVIMPLMILAAPSLLMADGPTTVSPEHLETNVNLPVEFIWNFYPQAVIFYQIQVDDDILFQSINIDETTASGLDTTYSTYSLNYGTQYFWRVRAYCLGGGGYYYSNWSTVCLFTVRSVVPQLVSPDNDAVDVLPPYTLEWLPIGGVISYQLQVDDNFTFSNPEIEVQLTPDVAQYEPDLDEDTRYFWRMRTLYYVDIYPTWSAWCADRNFTTAVTVPQQISPVDGTEHLCFPINLSWNEVKNASEYQYVCQDTAVGNSTGNTTSSTSVKIDEAWLDPFTAYKWYVKAKIDGQWYEYSPGWLFTTGPHHPPEPTLLSPSDGESDIELPFELDWEDEDDVVWYWVMVDDNDDFTSPEIDEKIHDSYLEVSGLDDETEYFWRVRVQNTCYWGDWCSNCCFITASLTGVWDAGSDILPEKLALGQNYPNPFNQRTVIEFALPENRLVVLEIYDVLGRKVRTLLSEYLDAGYKAVDWDGCDDRGMPVASGIYFYSIKSRDFSDSKKMILLK
jgi:hypothetical protein